MLGCNLLLGPVPTQRLLGDSCPEAAVNVRLFAMLTPFNPSEVHLSLLSKEITDHLTAPIAGYFPTPDSSLPYLV